MGKGRQRPAKAIRVVLRVGEGPPHLAPTWAPGGSGGGFFKSRPPESGTSTKDTLGAAIAPPHHWRCVCDRHVARRDIGSALRQADRDALGAEAGHDVVECQAEPIPVAHVGQRSAGLT